MVKQFEIKSDLLNEDLDVIRVRYTNCYKVIIRGTESKVQMTRKYVDFDELLEQFINQSIKNAYLETKIEELEKKIKNNK